MRDDRDPICLNLFQNLSINVENGANISCVISRKLFIAVRIISATSICFFSTSNSGANRVFKKAVVFVPMQKLKFSVVDGQGPLPDAYSRLSDDVGTLTDIFVCELSKSWF